MKPHNPLFRSLFLFILLAFPVYLLAANSQQQTTLQSLLHSLDYIAVDYPGAVIDGVVQDAGEYAEQTEFAAQMTVLLGRLPDTPQRRDIRSQIEGVQNSIAGRASGGKVAAQCRQISSRLIAIYNVEVTPRRVPSLEQGKQLFQAQCTQCHGVTGFGDGPQAAGLAPPPANFHDAGRQSKRSIYSLYSTITLGVNGTAMPAFDQFSESQRWALAFYASDFFANDKLRQQGASLWAEGTKKGVIKNIDQLTLLTPAEARQQGGEDAEALLAYLRANPEKLMPDSKNALQISRRKLAESLAAYDAGKPVAAYELAMSAYLDGFELTEGHLKTIAPELRKQVELSMAGLRKAVKAGKPIAEVEQQHRLILLQLDQVQTVLVDVGGSVMVILLSSMLILLREGLEAILVLAAIGAFLAKADRSHHFNYIHLGWISAVVLGIVTWVVAQHYIDISGASREMTEGIAALVASAMLLYVGFWLHRQSNARQWQKFLHGKLDGQITKGAVWGLVLVAFIAVYREVLETVLFYQAFWLQSPPSGQRYIIIGFVIALVALVILAWAIFRFSVRLPLRPFFLTNAVLLFVLSVVYAGKGIVALQEAGKLPVNPVRFPEIDLLGIYPNAESLGLQAMVLILGAVWLLLQRKSAAA